ncbi:MAG: HAD-IB family hydrolase [Pseudohongiella nitratireducens]|nr:HAD family hydrolase [Pseudohongiella nitratireducens]MDF1622341.1 HAD-IB family hydrolase [Pseudohongiella nitratireducens]
MTRLAIFDLDNTLLGGDSDHGWGEFLINEGLVDAEQHRQRNDAFYEQYKAGTLDMTEYLEFVVAILAGMPKAERDTLHDRFMQTVVEPMILPQAERLLVAHKARGDFCLIITATNRFITEPIAARLAVDDLIATDLEEDNGVYTGKISGIPSFQDGKITKLQEWLKQRDDGLSLADSIFYSDSFNDIPLLEATTEAVAVDPDDKLRAHAEKQGWAVISLRAVS